MGVASSPRNMLSSKLEEEASAIVVTPGDDTGDSVDKIFTQKKVCWVFTGVYELALCS